MTEFTPWDESAVRATLAHYCHRCDDGDFDGVAELFTADAVYAYGDRVARGPSGIVAFLGDSQGRPEQRGKHLTTNCVVDAEPGGDHARAVSDFVFLRHDDGRLVPTVAGRYRDRLVRSDGRWLIAERLIDRLGA